MGKRQKQCKYCGKSVEDESIYEHEDKCPENLENIDEGDSIECGDWQRRTNTIGRSLNEMEVIQRRNVNFRVNIPVTAWYECNNCGKAERLTEPISNEELFWLLEGEKYAEKKCGSCGEELISIPLKEFEKGENLGDKTIIAPKILLDISEHQCYRKEFEK